MNHDETKDDWNKVQLAIASICVEFESAFERDHNYRIEDILPSVDKLLEPFGFDSNQAGIMGQVIPALIKVEMELRFDAKQKFDRFEYYGRLPDFVTAIDESIKRIEKLDSDSRQLLVTVSMPQLSEPEETDEWIIVENGSSFLPGELGPFKQITKIGAGGFGVVCSAIDSRNDTKVALKFPRKNQLSNNASLKLFLAEAKRTKGLDHPGIVKTHSVEQIDGYLVIVMQLIEGTDLKETIEEARTPQEIAELVAQVADALGYAHLQGLVHRDLKPANILLDREGRPYIADFGLALHDSMQLSSPNHRCGTRPYMSPQQVAGLNKHLDGCTDIWSLGVILYELLVRRRPFRGNTEADIFEQIDERDPKPLRQIDKSVAKELQRICLRCLEKRAADRYPTGDELADDLRAWIGRPDEPTPAADTSAVFVPKGLRSYGAEDSAFFLRLLPGPRDRDDIPASIRFWSVRICEPVPEENRVPVGVIYGPSGSGKSSFVKAGLLPQVNHQVEAIYVESTQSDTEVRLIKALRNRFPEIPTDISLPDIFRGLSLGNWQSNGKKKILIVLDQFEQRLSQADDYSQSQLAKALRHCDGQELQCLLLIRDDFWLALTRFCDALEMDLLEGQNSQDIDLFDREHAKKVLIKLGRAYNRLPDESTELSKSQESFLEQAIDQLAVGNYIICVRLTLFAEMFKSRDWTPAELKAVGGVSGTGEKFLAATFGAGSRKKRHQTHREPAQLVLETLLPAAGTDIRGAMKPERELMAAAKLESQPTQFYELTKLLDDELKLITRTSPDYLHSEKPGQSESDQNGWYQLTHDYLVHSLRTWLDAGLEKTWLGRRRIRFRRLVRRYATEPDKQILPSLVGYLAFVFAITNVARWEAGAFWKDATTKAVKQFITATLILSSMTLAIGITYSRYNDARFRELFSALLKCEPQAFPVALENLVPYKSRVVREVQMALTARLKSSNEEFDRDYYRTILVACRFSSSIPPKMLDMLVEHSMKSPILESRNLISIVRNRANTKSFILAVDRYWATMDKRTEVKLAAIACAMCEFKYAESMARDLADPSRRTRLVHVLPEVIYDWLELLEFANQKNISNDLLYAIVLAVGKAKPDRNSGSDLLERENENATVSLLEKMKTSKDEGVRSAAEWSLRQYSTRPKRTSTDPRYIRMVRIRGGTLKRQLDPEFKHFGYGFPSPNVQSQVNGFQISVSEVTQELFSLFLEDPEGKDYAVRTALKYDRAQILNDQPVGNISLLDAIHFCNWLSKTEKLQECYVPDKGAWRFDSTANGYRLPNANELEYASRGGAETTFNFGNLAEFEFLNSFACTSHSVLIESKKIDVRSLMPNRFGIHDTLGNIEEWCSNSLRIPQLDLNAPYETMGGSYTSKNKELFCFKRNPAGDPSLRLLTFGFRVTRSQPARNDARRPQSPASTETLQ